MAEELVEKCLKKGVLKVFTDILRLKRVVKEEATQQLLQLIGVMRKFVVLAVRNNEYLLGRQRRDTRIA